MAIREILLLGHPGLYQVCEPVEPGELDLLSPVIQDLHDTLLDFRQKYGAGRAIAAPQIGVMKQLVYLCIETPVVFINPTLNEFTCPNCSSTNVTIWRVSWRWPALLISTPLPYAASVTGSPFKVSFERIRP
jgi:peptide deformylase